MRSDIELYHIILYRAIVLYRIMLPNKVSPLHTQSRAFLAFSSESNHYKCVSSVLISSLFSLFARLSINQISWLQLHFSLHFLVFFYYPTLAFPPLPPLSYIKRHRFLILGTRQCGFRVFFGFRGLFCFRHDLVSWGEPRASH